MKITSDKLHIENLETSNSLKPNLKSKLFEAYLKTALQEIESEKSSRIEKSPNEVIYEKLNQSLILLEKISSLLSKGEISFSETLTISDYLITQTKEINALLKSLPESPVKKLFKDFCILLGVEAQKLKQIV